MHGRRRDQGERTAGSSPHARAVWHRAAGACMGGSRGVSGGGSSSRGMHGGAAGGSKTCTHALEAAGERGYACTSHACHPCACSCPALSAVSAASHVHVRGDSLQDICMAQPPCRSALCRAPRCMPPHGSRQADSDSMGPRPMKSMAASKRCDLWGICSAWVATMSH